MSGADMSTNNDDTTTTDDGSRTRRVRPSTPVLLLGSFISKSSRVVALDRPVTIGRGRVSADGVRGSDAEVILQADRTLSRSHLRIARSSGAWTVEDLDSKNGTFVDGRRVEKPMRLVAGNVVQFGNQAAVFRMVSEDELSAIEAEVSDPFGPVATLSPSLAVILSALRA